MSGYWLHVSGPETRHIPLHLLQTWPARFYAEIIFGTVRMYTVQYVVSMFFLIQWGLLVLLFQANSATTPLPWENRHVDDLHYSGCPETSLGQCEPIFCLKTRRLKNIVAGNMTIEHLWGTSVIRCCIVIYCKTAVWIDHAKVYTVQYCTVHTTLKTDFSYRSCSTWRPSRGRSTPSLSTPSRSLRL